MDFDVLTRAGKELAKERDFDDYSTEELRVPLIQALSDTWVRELLFTTIAINGEKYPEASGIDDPAWTEIVEMARQDTLTGGKFVEMLDQGLEKENLQLPALKVDVTPFAIPKTFSVPETPAGAAAPLASALNAPEIATLKEIQGQLRAYELASPAERWTFSRQMRKINREHLSSELRTAIVKVFDNFDVETKRKEGIIRRDNLRKESKRQAELDKEEREQDFEQSAQDIVKKTKAKRQREQQKQKDEMARRRRYALGLLALTGCGSIAAASGGGAVGPNQMTHLASQNVEPVMFNNYGHIDQMSSKQTDWSTYKFIPDKNFEREIGGPLGAILSKETEESDFSTFVKVQRPKDERDSGIGPFFKEVRVRWTFKDRIPKEITRFLFPWWSDTEDPKHVKLARLLENVPARSERFLISLLTLIIHPILVLLTGANLFLVLVPVFLALLYVINAIYLQISYYSVRGAYLASEMTRSRDGITIKGPTGSSWEDGITFNPNQWLDTGYNYAFWIILFLGGFFVIGRIFSTYVQWLDFKTKKAKAENAELSNEEKRLKLAGPKSSDRSKSPRRGEAQLARSYLAQVGNNIEAAARLLAMDPSFS